MNKRSLAGPWGVVAVALGAMCLVPGATQINPGALPTAVFVIVGALTLGVLCAIALSRKAGVVIGAVPLRMLALLGWASVSVMWSDGLPGPSLTRAAAVAVAVLIPVIALSADLATRPASTIGALPLLAGSTVWASVVPAVAYQVENPLSRTPLPLGASSSVALPLALALGCLVPRALAATVHRNFWRWTTAVACVLVILSASRIALLCSLVVIILTVARQQGRLSPQLLRGVAGLGLIGLVSMRVMRGKFPGLDDPRLDNAQVALRAWDSDRSHVLFGLGDGSIWPWFAIETGRVPQHENPYLHTSAWGEVLWQPHSLLLWALVETGLVGLLLVVGMLGTTAIAALKAVAVDDSRLWGPAIGLLVTLPTVVTETHLVRNFPAALLWFSVAVVVEHHQRAARRARPGRYVEEPPLPSSAMTRPRGDRHCPPGGL